MNLQKLFEMQKGLRGHIGYDGPDRFNKLTLALLVEIGECANEHRGFKFWSKDQKPRTKALRFPAMMEEDKEYYNPLLEEYVDGLHFVLEIGLEFKFENEKPFLVHTDYEVEKMFLNLYKISSQLLIVGGREHKRYYFGELLSNYLGLGKMLGFTWEQIEQAYLDKNKINHRRQENGY